MNWNWKNTALMGAGTKKAPLLRACRSDQRFSYWLYLPKGFCLEHAAEYGIAAVIHGTARNAEKLRDQFADFADETKHVILAPVFPAGIIDREDIHNYKFIKFHDIRFDRILLDMVDEVRETFGITQDKILLHGFSGGGQFSHRMLYLHPQRLAAVSVGAPGRATYLDPSEPWPVGISDFKEQFGVEIDMEEVKKVPVLLLVGAEDKEVVNYEEDITFRESAQKYGNNRLEKIKALYENYLQHQMNVRLTEVPGLAHEGMKMVPQAVAYFKEILGE
ncbi:alpha/beta hydrolase [Clostridium sp. MCC353]|uniref:alpha/beta hydrolase n=1 Tax=Clostridium sp. MCC353 TaxID=2592646 RepID=UPI001C035723|nr:alpha/beta hydrolase [Clostridium sp. MCC353]MBT9778333.1 alpha/beta hydrolase [Clostridium sp. MCC353]